MVSRPHLRSILSTFALYVVSALLIGYFWINAHSGNHGLKAKLDLEREIAALNGELIGVRQERERWQGRVALLKSDRLDPDILDERARALLNYVDPRDVILTIKR